MLINKRIITAALFGAALGTTAVSAAAQTAHMPVSMIAGSSSYALSNRSWGMVANAPDGFVIGSPKAPQLVAFLDPNCSVCNRFYDELQPLIKSGKISVRVLMVGLIKHSSPGKAAHIVLPLVDPSTHQTPQDLLATSEDKFKKGAAGGHISPVSNPMALAVVDDHNDILERLTALYAGFPRGRIETPVIVVTDHGVHRVIFGAPPQGAAKLVAALDK